MQIARVVMSTDVIVVGKTVSTDFWSRPTDADPFPVPQWALRLRSRKGHRKDIWPRGPIQARPERPEPAGQVDCPQEESAGPSRLPEDGSGTMSGR